MRFLKAYMVDIEEFLEEGNRNKERSKIMQCFHEVMHTFLCRDPGAWRPGYMGVRVNP